MHRLKFNAKLMGLGKTAISGFYCQYVWIWASSWRMFNTKLPSQETGCPHHVPPSKKIPDPWNIPQMPPQRCKQERIPPQVVEGLAVCSFRFFSSGLFLSGYYLLGAFLGTKFVTLTYPKYSTKPPSLMKIFPGWGSAWKKTFFQRPLHQRHQVKEDKSRRPKTWHHASGVHRISLVMRFMRLNTYPISNQQMFI